MLESIYYTYLCKPNPSGKGMFILTSCAPVSKGDHIFRRAPAKRYEVLQVQHAHDGVTLVVNEVKGTK